MADATSIATDLRHAISDIEDAITDLETLEAAKITGIVCDETDPRNSPLQEIARAIAWEDGESWFTAGQDQRARYLRLAETARDKIVEMVERGKKTTA